MANHALVTGPPASAKLSAPRATAWTLGMSNGRLYRECQRAWSLSNLNEATSLGISEQCRMVHPQSLKTCSGFVTTPAGELGMSYEDILLLKGRGEMKCPAA